MAFMSKKKKYKFQVETCLEELTAVPFVNAVLFAKVRLLDGGSFSETSTREEVREHSVSWGARFQFVCKMSANVSTGVLDPCVLRVSVRKELKGGRSFQKLGFTDLNLAEFAGSGQLTRRCLLEGYDTRHRQDNSMLRVSIRMNMLSGDPLFKVPSPSAKHKPVALVEEGAERRDDGSINSGSSGFGSLPKKRPALFPEMGSAPERDALEVPEAAGETEEGHEPGHSRNSSNTSQLSKGSGYGSLNSQSQHSRQSSSGDSGHIRSPSWPVWAPRLPPLPSSPGPEVPSSPSTERPRLHFWSSHSSSGLRHPSEPPSPMLQHGPSEPPSPSFFSRSKLQIPFPPWASPRAAPRATSSPGMLHSPRGLGSSPDGGAGIGGRRNPSTGPSETGSLDRAKLERRKKATEGGTAGSAGRVEMTRVNPDSLIDELLSDTNLGQLDGSAETSGLQLFIAKDGTTALGSHEVKSQAGAGVFKQVVMDSDNR